MTDPRTTGAARRVVLLARPGGARDRMREALDQAGANVVLEADPTATDEAAVLAAQPEVALVVLDAATDEALERFPGLLADASVDVLFEEAELAVGRVGWDAARWVRHLGAKLRGSGDVLPPGAEPVAAAPARASGTDAAPQVGDVPPELPPELPPVLQEEAAAEPPPLPPLPDLPQRPDLPASVSQAASVGPAVPAPVANPDADSGFDLVLPDLEDEAAPASPSPSAPASSASPFANLSLEPLDEPSSTDIRIEGLERFDEGTTATRIEGLQIEGLERFGDGAPTEIRIEGLERPDAEAPTDIRIEGLERDDASAPAEVSFEGLALEGWELDEHAMESPVPELPVPERPVQEPPRPDALSSMQGFAGEVAGATVNGAVLVLAGIGGPDAVRQLLGALPDAFPRPVLVQQRLDGGHYDKLVMQMQRATRLPVRLAAAGDAAQAGTVYVLPPAVGVQDTGTGLAFTGDGSDLFAALPAGDSGVLMLSGSDPARVDEAVALAGRGAFVAAQALDGCYDVAAPAALASRGLQSGSPVELAGRLAERWS